MTDWHFITCALVHPTQVAIIVRLDGEVRSPKQLADALGVPLATVSHHVRHLRDRGLLELVHERRKRGGMEHFYTLRRSELAATA